MRPNQAHVWRHGARPFDRHQLNSAGVNCQPQAIPVTQGNKVSLFVITSDRYCPSVAKQHTSSLGKYWGYLLFVVLITAWWTQSFGPVGLIALSALTMMFFLFRAPVWCGAVTRGNDFCRKNARGLLMGCSYQQHKWQKLKLAVVPPKWRQLNRGLWISPEKSLASVAALGGGLSAVAAVVQLLIAK
jgi:hypothetical protein